MKVVNNKALRLLIKYIFYWFIILICVLFIRNNKSNSSLKEGWKSEDFIITDSGYISGFSDKGLHKIKENKKLVFPEMKIQIFGITKYAFEDYDILSVDFSNLKELKRIEEGAFANNKIKLLECAMLSKLEVIDNMAFYNNELINVDLENCSNLRDINYLAFANNNIVGVKLPENLYKIGGAAFTQNKIKNLDLSDLKKLTILSIAAFETNNIETVDFTNTSNIKIIGHDVFNNNNKGNLITFNGLNYKYNILDGRIDYLFVNTEKVDREKYFQYSDTIEQFNV